jgi:hypothetical protein
MFFARISFHGITSFFLFLISPVYAQNPPEQPKPRSSYFQRFIQDRPIVALALTDAVAQGGDLYATQSLLARGGQEANPSTASILPLAE